MITSDFSFQFFTVVEQRVTQMQPPDKQPGMAKCFQDLMENVERNLATKNRDRFVLFLTGVLFCGGVVIKSYQ